MSQQVLIDCLGFVRNRGVLEGKLPLTRFSRLGDYLVESSGDAAYRLAGHVDVNGRKQLLLEVEGELSLRCQRCLESIHFPLYVDSVLELIRSDDDLSQEDLEDDSKDFLVAQRDLDVVGLIEDEIILALPAAPRHQNCALPSADRGTAEESPFAALAALKRKDS